MQGSRSCTRSKQEAIGPHWVVLRCRRDVLSVAIDLFRIIGTTGRVSVHRGKLPAASVRCDKCQRSEMCSGVGLAVFITAHSSAKGQVNMQEQRFNQRNAGPVVSEFANDPDMLELIEMFVDELPQRIQSLQSSYESQMMDELQRLSHQLKGACGGYGFPTLGEAAAQLEGLLKSGPGDPTQVETALNELIDLCRRASAGGGDGRGC